MGKKGLVFLSVALMSCSMVGNKKSTATASASQSREIANANNQIGRTGRIVELMVRQNHPWRATWSFWNNRQGRKNSLFNNNRRWDIRFTTGEQLDFFAVGERHKTGDFIIDLGEMEAHDCDVIEISFRNAGRVYIADWIQNYARQSNQRIPYPYNVNYRESVKLNHCYLAHNRHSDKYLTTLFYVGAYQTGRAVELSRVRIVHRSSD